MHTSRPAAVVPLAVSLAIAAPLLTGCSLIPHVGGGVSLPGVSVGTGHLPKDWPSEVPVPTGDVVSGASLGGDAAKGKVWNATIKVGGPDAAAEITSQLEDAGFQSQSVGSTDQGSTAVYRKARYDVAVVVTKDDANGWVANYTVTYDPSGSR